MLSMAFWRSLILSFFIFSAFVAVEQIWAVKALVYHWFTFAAAGIVITAVPLAWRPVLRKRMVVVRIFLTTIIIAGTVAVLSLLTRHWPGVLLYEGSGGFDEVSLFLGFWPIALFSLLLVLPIVIFGDTGSDS
jgi:hypothetical protein